MTAVSRTAQPRRGDARRGGCRAAAGAARRWLGRAPARPRCSARRTSSSCSSSSPTRSSSPCGCRSTTTSSPRPAPSSTARSSGSTTTSRCSRIPPVWQSFGNVGIFLLINVPLTVVLSLLLADGAEQDRARRALLPGQLLRALRHRIGRGRRRVAVPLQPRRTREPGPRPARARAVVARQLGARHADDRALRHVEGHGVLHPALPGGAAERVEGALRGGIRRRRRARPRSSSRSPCPACGRRPSSCCCSPRSRARTSSPSPTCSPAAAARTAPPRRPCCSCTRRASSRAIPDVASAIGVILIILVLIIAWIQRRFVGKED